MSDEMTLDETDEEEEQEQPTEWAYAYMFPCGCRFRMTITINDPDEDWLPDEPEDRMHFIVSSIWPEGIDYCAQHAGGAA